MVYPGLRKYRSVGAAFLALIAWFTFSLHGGGAIVPPKKNILLFHSYHQGYKWTDDITRGVKTTLEPGKHELNLFIEYMDSKRVPGQDHFDQLLELYENKYKNYQFQVIIASDDNAFNFLRRHRDRLFPGTPVVFCGVNFFKSSDLEGVSRFTGVNEDIDLKATIDLALRLHPETRKMLVVNDLTTTGQKIHQRLEKILPLYRDRLAVQLLEDVSMEEIRRTVQAQPRGSIVFYTLFFRDKNGAFFEYDDSIRLITEISSCPVYGTWDFSLGSGMIGGMMTSGFFQGQTAGKLAARILEGEDIENIPVVLKSPNRYIFDYNPLERFGISESDLPENSLILNRPVSLYSQYKTFIWIGIVVIACFIIIIMLLSLNVWRRRQVELELKQASDELEQRVLERTEELARINEQLVKQVEERRKAEQEIQELHERFSLAFEASPTPMSLSRFGDGRIFEVNNRFLELFGYTRQEVIDRTSIELGLYNAAERAHVLHQMERSGSLRNFEIKLHARDGREVDVLMSMEYLLIDRHRYLLTALVDISERKEVEETLRKSEERFRKMAENIQDGLTIYENGQLIFVNSRMCQISGYSPSEYAQLETIDFVVPEDRPRVRQVMEEFTESGTVPQQVEFEIIKKDGSRCYVQNRYSYHCDERGVISLYIVTSDITQRKRMETALRESKEKTEAANRELQEAVEHARQMTRAAEDANAAKSEFLANMSHEIRTPMNGVIGFSEMLMETPLSREQRDFVQAIKQSGDALLSLINSILDFSKIEAGQLEFEALDFDPEQLAYDVCEVIYPRLGDRPIEIICRIDDKLPSAVVGDPMRFRQVLVNLMGNASKFTETGEIELSINMTEETRNRVMLHTTVRDTGIGIPKGKLDNIFDAFQQADGSTTRKYGGTGLGLSICKQIARLMDGDIYAQSEEGKGSTFHFTAWVGRVKQEQERTIPDMSGVRGLLVDDNKSNLRILESQLHAIGLDTVTVEDGRDVLPALRNALEDGYPFDFCLCDIRMPLAGGYEIARQVRRSEPPLSALPMVALSSLVDHDMKKCREAGFDGFIAKPVRRDNLYSTLEKLMGLSDERYKTDEWSRDAFITQTAAENGNSSVRILLVEDNPINQKLARMILTRAGCRVEVASNGLEAVERYTCAPHNIDLIFMDIQMPEMDGKEATRNIRQRGFHSVPIIAMTASAMKGDREKCLDAGMDDYITKPIKKQYILAALDKWLPSGKFSRGEKND